MNPPTRTGYNPIMPDPSKYRGRRPKRSTPQGAHIPIMVREILDAFQLKPGQTVVDLTLGHGGHTEHFLTAVSPGGTVLAMDLDKVQAQLTQDRLQQIPHQANLVVELGNFAGMDQALARNNLPLPHGILADLGISSMQIDDPNRGFSYRREGPLDMRMDCSRGDSAREVLDKITPEDLAQALEEYGDMPLAAPFARTLLKKHQATPFETTTQLADFCLEWQKGSSPVSKAKDWKLRVGKRKWETHPAARVFQALRILVNRELANLKHLLRLIPDLLAPGGTVALLSFHSGEDRLVKAAFEQGLRQGKYSQTSDGPIRATFEERTNNPRSRSAKLRWAQKAPTTTDAPL